MVSLSIMAEELARRVQGKVHLIIEASSVLSAAIRKVTVEATRQKERRSTLQSVTFYIGIMLILPGLTLNCCGPRASDFELAEARYYKFIRCVFEDDDELEPLTLHSAILRDELLKGLDYERGIVGDVEFSMEEHEGPVIAQMVIGFKEVRGTERAVFLLSSVSLLTDTGATDVDLPMDFMSSQLSNHRYHGKCEW